MTRWSERGTSRIAVWLTLLMVAASACGTDGEVSPTSTTTGSSTVGETTAEVQAGIDWFVALVNGGRIDESEYSDRFAGVFRDQVSYDAFIEVVGDLRRSAPFVVIDRGPDGRVGYAVVENETGTRFRINASLDDGGRFEGLLVQPETFPEMANPPETLDAGFGLLDRIGRFGGLAAEITDGTCAPIASVRPVQPIPLGSAFKLYLLGALAMQVDAGTVSWDDELVITDELKSIPTGVLQDRESGSTVTVRRAAELMISISDNTAADLVAAHLGRRTIEAALPELGMADPGVTIPFLTTLEFAALKLFVDDTTRLAYVDGGIDERRSILTDLDDVTVDRLRVSEFVLPVEPDDIEWFATPEDLCRLAVVLDELSRRPGLEPVAAILSLNPGVPDPDGRWSEIWFKGGSEPGLLAVWWVVEGSGGRRFVLAGSNVDAEANIDTDDALLVWSALRNLLDGR